MTEIITADEYQTQEAAKEVAELLKPGSFIALYGDLGAGKTAFTRGLAAALGVKEPVSSPTFTMLKVYSGGRIPIYHYDAYRISDLSELTDLDYYELAESDGVCIVEWADLIKEELPGDRLDISIEYAEPENFRKIRIVPQGAFKEALN